MQLITIKLRFTIMITTLKNFKNLSSEEMKEVKGGSTSMNPDCRCYHYDEPRPKAYCFSNGPDPLPFCDMDLGMEWYCPCWTGG